MLIAMAVQVTIYLNEADQWQHRPLHLEILSYCAKKMYTQRRLYTPWLAFWGDIAWKRRT